MVHGDTSSGEDATDEQAAVASRGILLAAHDRYAIAGDSLL
jgi:hypothetical protein